MGIAEKIVVLRGKESRAKFAAKLGINANTLRNYESGQSLPNSDVLAQICLVSGVDPRWLLFDEEEPVEKQISPYVMEDSKYAKQHIVKAKSTLTAHSDDEGDALELPPTSTIEDNKEISAEIDGLIRSLRDKFASHRVRHLIHLVDNITEAFSIPSDSKYASYGLWPEDMGPVLIEYLQDRIKMIDEEGLDSWRNVANMIPSDDELDRREAEVFRRFNLKPTSKDVTTWFSSFFGKDTKLKRSRFCRFAFVVYAEGHIRSLDGIS